MLQLMLAWCAIQDESAARAAFRQCRWAEAASEATQVLESNPDSVESWWVLAWARERTGQPKLAEEAIQKALALGPNDSWVRVIDAWIQLRRMDYKRALDGAGEAIRLDPKFVKAHVARGRALIGLGRFEDARQAASRALELEPEVIDASRVLAESFLEEGRAEFQKGGDPTSLLTKAREVLVNKEFFEGSEFLLLRGRVYFEIFLSQGPTAVDEKELALKDLDQAILIDPRDANAYRWRGSYWDAVMEKEKAVADWERALELDPTLETILKPMIEKYKGTGPKKDT